MDKKEALKYLKDFLIYLLIAGKSLVAFVMAIYVNPGWLFLYFVVDVVVEAIKRKQESSNKNLDDERLNRIIKSQKSAKQDFDKLQKEQVEYFSVLQVKNQALKLLNRLINEGLIRGKDLLALSGSSEYYSLFVYSVNPSRLFRGVKNLSLPKRLYPIFLNELGFARLGQNSSQYIISKETLKDKRLRSSKNMKKFLLYHFSKLKSAEWEEVKNYLEKKKPKLYEQYKNKSFNELGIFKTNFLLAEANINVSNIGYVDDDIIGLARVDDNQRVNEQIFTESKLKKIDLGEEIKVKIRQVITKLDISFLLDEIEAHDKKRLDEKQDILKRRLGVDMVIEFFRINEGDLSRELVKIGFPNEKADVLCKSIIEKSKIYKEALLELGININ